MNDRPSERDAELEAARDLAAAWVAKAAEAEAARRQAAEELAVVRGELAAARREIHALRNTRLLRWTARPRRLYAGLRRRIGVTPDR